MKTFEGTVYDPISDGGEAVIRTGVVDFLRLADMLDEVFNGCWMDAEGKRVRITIEPVEEESDAK